MSVNKKFRKKLIEQQKGDKQRSLSQKTKCLVKILKHTKIEKLKEKFNKSRNYIGRKRFFRQVRPDSESNFQKEPSRDAQKFIKPSELKLLKLSIKQSSKFYNNSLYNESSQSDVREMAKQPKAFREERQFEYDYFQDDYMKQEEKTFSRYCESIVNKISVRNEKFSSEVVSDSDNKDSFVGCPSLVKVSQSLKDHQTSQKSQTHGKFQSQKKEKSHPNDTIKRINGNVIFFNRKEANGNRQNKLSVKFGREIVSKKKPMSECYKEVKTLPGVKNSVPIKNSFFLHHS